MFQAMRSITCIGNLTTVRTRVVEQELHFQAPAPGI